MMRIDTPQVIRLKDYQPSAYLIDQVEMDFRLEPSATEVTTRTAFRANPERRAATPLPLVLDGEELETLSVTLDGRVLGDDDYTVGEQRLTVHRPPAQPFTLETTVRINPEANTALSGLYRSSGNYCTQCEAEGFRRITWFLDRPDVLTRYRVRIEADRAQAPVLLANGNMVESGELADGRHFAVWEDPFPKPSYLFALVAGDLAMVEDIFTTMSGRNVTLRIFVEHGKEDRCDWAMQSLKLSMKWDEERFGREYDLDIFMIVAVSDFNMGAMENKGLNVFNDKYILALPETATDADYAAIEAIIAHEYFHNWSGNRVTCRDWFQLCLKEGLTVFRDQEFTSDVRSRPVKRISDVRTLRAHQFPEDAGPLSHPGRPSSFIEINNFYTATVYEKGAEVVRMIQTLIGAKAFRKAMDLYFERHDGEAATVEQFVQCMADVSGRDFGQFFNWYRQAGTPQVVADGKWDAGENTYKLTVSQTTAATPGEDDKAPFLIPLGIGLIDSDGDDMALRLKGQGALNAPLIELTEPVQTFTFEGVTERPVLSLNRGFSAPIRLQTGQSIDDLSFLMGHDGDSFNRWEAAQRVALNAIVGLVRGGDEVPAGYVKAMGQVIGACADDPAYLALMLALPPHTDIAAELGHDVDPAAVHAARERVAATIGRELADELAGLVAANTDDGPYSPDAASAGQRSCRFAALGLLAAGDPDTWLEMVAETAATARNMAEEMAALGILAGHDSPLRTEAFAAFHERHKQDHLLVDKWFTLEGMVPLDATVERVRELMEHPDFSMRRPNRVRALIGSFSTANPVAFNRPDGAGYELVTDVILKLDKANPQIAARMATCFRSWRILEAGRRDKARAALARIRDTQGLSRDLSEIAARSLGDD